jgi:hypothetical protein
MDAYRVGCGRFVEPQLEDYSLTQRALIELFVVMLEWSSVTSLNIASEDAEHHLI